MMIHMLLSKIWKNSYKNLIIIIHFTQVGGLGWVFAKWLKTKHFNILQLENNDSYMSGGAGYVLSRAAVKLLVEKGIGLHKACMHKMEESEDINMG